MPADPAAVPPPEVVTLSLYAAWADSEHGRLMLSKPLSHFEAFAAGRASVDVRAVREGALRDVVAYAESCAATCREAERERGADIANRGENHAILPMLREQHFAWGEKAKSYDALVAFVLSLLHTPPSGGAEGAQVMRYTISGGPYPVVPPKRHHGTPPEEPNR